LAAIVDVTANTATIARCLTAVANNLNTTTTSSAIRSRTRSHSERESSANLSPVRRSLRSRQPLNHQRQDQCSNQHNVPACAARASQTCAYFDQRSLLRTNKSTSSSTAKAASEKAYSPRHSSEDPEIVAAFVRAVDSDREKKEHNRALQRCGQPKSQRH